MVAQSDEEWKKIILNRLCYWMNRISGKSITPKRLKEAKKITNEVIENKNKKLNK